MTQSIEFHHPLDKGYSFSDLDWAVKSVKSRQCKIDNDYLIDMLQNGTGVLYMSLKDRNISFHPLARHYVFSLDSRGEDGSVDIRINRMDTDKNIIGEHTVNLFLDSDKTLLNTPYTLFHVAIQWHAKDYGPGFKDKERRAQWEAGELDQTQPASAYVRGLRL